MEGEHKLFTGERLIVELGANGAGILIIINDDLITKVRANK